MALTTRRQHSGGAIQTTLSVGIGSGDLTINITAPTGWPDGSVGPFFVVIDRGLTSEEKVLITSRSANVLTVTTRGVDGTTATTHASGAAIFPVWTATEADEANAHSSTGVGVHGIAGNVVGDSDVQTLANKTISAASNTITGLSPGGALVGTTATQALTNKTIDYTLNTISNLPANAGASLARVYYNPASVTTGSSGSAGTVGVYVAVDTVNLTIAFTVPASGRVEIELGGTFGQPAGTSNGYWAVGPHGSTTVAGSAVLIFDTNIGSRQHASALILLTGLTPGASVSYDWLVAVFAGGGAAVMSYGGAAGPAVMRVTAA
jgi:hypothetical protein